jgi:glycosyltransferase involved in cell wall biosynthesis
LIEAAPKVVAQGPEVLFLVGGGQEQMKDDLQRRVEGLGMKNHFLFWGEVPWEQAARFISAFDLAVAPARFSNSRSGISPQKVYAYLACERPVVGSNIEGLGNMLIEEGVGLSFPAGDAEQLAEAILKLLKDQNLVMTMGRAGRRLVLERFTWERAVRETVQIIHRCLGPIRELDVKSSVS